MNYKYGSRYFKYHKELTKYLNDFQIKSEDVISIASQDNGFVLFYKVIKNPKQDEYALYYTLQRLYEVGYDELIDELYHYMKAYINDLKIDAYMHADCIENLIGIREHEDIIEYIKTQIL